MRCMFCRKGPPDGVSVFRVNAKGQPGVWACQQHINQTDTRPDDDVVTIVNALSGPKRKKGNRP